MNEKQSCSCELRNYYKSKDNNNKHVRQILPFIINAIDDVDTRLKKLENGQLDESCQLDEGSTVRLDESAIKKLEKELDEVSQKSKQVSEEEEQIEKDLMDDDDNCSVHTVEVEREKEKIVANPDVLIGQWRAGDHHCRDCLKQSVKTYKKSVKEQEKERKKKEKELKKLQKELLIKEQNLLKKKIKDLKRNKKNQNYGVDLAEQERLRQEITKMAKDNNLNSHMHINMYL